MFREPEHPILEKPWEWSIGSMHYHVGLDGTEPYLDLTLARGAETRRLRFWSPQNLSIEEGFPQPTGGMVILDARHRGLEGLGVEVTDLESSWGSNAFWARDVVDLDTMPTD